MSNTNYQIPLLTLSGGIADAEDCLRFRVWICPHAVGEAIDGQDNSDYCKEYNTLVDAEDTYRRYGRRLGKPHEAIIGVVWDNTAGRFREVVIQELLDKA